MTNDFITTFITVLFILLIFIIIYYSYIKPSDSVTYEEYELKGGKFNDNFMKKWNDDRKDYLIGNRPDRIALFNNVVARYSSNNPNHDYIEIIHDNSIKNNEDFVHLIQNIGMEDGYNPNTQLTNTGNNFITEMLNLYLYEPCTNPNNKLHLFGNEKSCLCWLISYINLHLLMDVAYLWNSTLKPESEYPKGDYYWQPPRIVPYRLYSPIRIIRWMEGVNKVNENDYFNMRNPEEAFENCKIIYGDIYGKVCDIIPYSPNELRRIAYDFKQHKTKYFTIRDKEDPPPNIYATKYEPVIYGNEFNEAREYGAVHEGEIGDSAAVLPIATMPYFIRSNCVGFVIHLHGIHYITVIVVDGYKLLLVDDGYLRQECIVDRIDPQNNEIYNTTLRHSGFITYNKNPNARFPYFNMFDFIQNFRVAKAGGIMLTSL